MAKTSSLSAKQVRSMVMLLLTSVIWGITFTFQKQALEHIDVFTFTAIRFLLASLILFIFILIKDKLEAKTKRTNSKKLDASTLVLKEDKADNKTQGFFITKDTLIAGSICGIILVFANLLQMNGIRYTSVGKAGFITVLYIIIVPIVGVFFKRKIPKIVWLSVAFALLGSFLLFINKEFALNIGDFLVLGSSFLFAGQIMVIEHFSPKTDSLKLALIQFFTCGFFSAILMLIYETIDFSAIYLALLPIVFSGVITTGIGYTMQIIAQKNLSAPVASLIMSMESVFAVLAGWLILQQVLSFKEILGCFLIFVGISLVSIPIKRKSYKKKLS